jgi:hypothetical protein
MSEPQPNILIDNANKVLRDQAQERRMKVLEKQVAELEKRLAAVEKAGTSDTKKS